MKFVQTFVFIIIIANIISVCDQWDNPNIDAFKKAKKGDVYLCFVETIKYFESFTKYQNEHIALNVESYKIFGGNIREIEDKYAKIMSNSLNLEINLFVLLILFMLKTNL